MSRQSGVEGHIYPGGIHSRLRLAKIQFGRESDIETPPDQTVGGPLRLQGGLGQFEGFPIRGEGQVRVGDSVIEDA